MDNFTNTPLGYDKKEVNDFVDYVIKKTEDNILTIKKQKDEIEFLKRENERLKKLEDSYTYIQMQIENVSSEIKSNAKYEAELIIKEAKDNASSIVNDALLKTQKINNEREVLINSTLNFKKKVKSAIREQLDILEEIEML
ncbi:MAG: DivIVA domain-containing protein [bacterium]|nr:DivIVA domain-containing protein [bacterium]